jgi:signal transduction histidine kinase
MATLVLLNMVLVVLASVLVYRQFQRGATQTSELQEKVRLSVTELAALSSHLQYVSEREKKALARDLHDALGGLLVGTKMDVAWIRNRLGSIDAAIETRFARIQQALDQGIDFKRRVVEQLRPTLLDNMGLFAALRWQFQENCARANLQCHHVVPQHELVLLSDAAIGLFRVVQEALTNILKHAHASAAWLDVEVLEHELQIRVADNGRGMTAQAQIRGGQGLTSMRHRVTALGGSIEIRPRTAGGTEVLVRVPLARILASGAAPEESTDGAPASSATALPADQT